ncbi:type VI secretion system baseplate subunit TssF [Trinickia soli]|uniref:Type VI secretion system baseplate subunit TssF n=1 Tax=Trinickia soli TaxID=380675 RepID=A0A2N7VXK5_9BURK|nr:type VI secretion system baseplate subunit TssF [Trinickia soli]PMS21886.1 type VI secretion system baseplate subunit TssF [Trinickia soli]CAB3650032.1 hypothetical protein LMG24076_00900 [Trinickia soli]
MNDTLFAYYEDELRHLREAGAQFSAEFPKVAARLGMDGMECADPYVERLLEGFSFLAARVRMEIDAQFPRFTQHLAEMLYPGLLAPTPSMAVVQFEPDVTHPALSRGVTVQRGTALMSQLGRDGTTRCEYRTAQTVQLLPLRLVQARYRAFDCLPAGIGANLSGAHKATVSLSFEWSAGAQAERRALDRLSLFLRGAEGLAQRLYLQLTGRVCGGYVRLGEGKGVRYVPLPARCVRGQGFDDAEALLPLSGSTFRGCRLLREYFAFPERFSFVELSGLQQVPWDGSRTFEIVLLLDERDETLLRCVDEANFALHCTPAINLFARRTDRIAVDDRKFEHHVVVERTRPIDFEVFGIEGVDGYLTGRTQPQRFSAFYRARDPGRADGSRAYFQARRSPRLLSASERALGARSRYLGTEVFVALVDPSEAPYSAQLQQLGIDTLCTNRHLPLSMPIGTGSTDFTGRTDLPAIERIRCVAGPSAPRPALAEGSLLWRLLDTLSTSRLPLIERAGAQDRGGSPSYDAQPLRQWLSALCPAGEHIGQHRIAQLRQASARAITRRLPLPGPVCFGRGLEISLTFDDAAWAGAGASVFGAVLAVALAEYMPINQFAETVVRTTGQGEVMRYAARAGRCEML